MKWSIEKSKDLDSNVIWLLQYREAVNNRTIRERKELKTLLEKAKVRYIDTYEYLHGDSNIDIGKDQIWIGHHTPLGNKIVCKAIINSGFYN